MFPGLRRETEISEDEEGERERERESNLKFLLIKIFSFLTDTLCEEIIADQES